MDWLGGLGLWGLFIGTFLAATILPFSSDALYLAILAATQNPVGCLIVGTLGNWLGSVFSYWMGRLGKWEWIEKWFRVKPETLSRQKAQIDRYGVWLALIAWIPVIGDVIAIALGFYKARPVATIFLLLVGKFLRFLVWNLLFGLL
ncbi:MAG: YqaA family protein [Candidatus Cryptobacteroides sp.]